MELSPNLWDLPGGKVENGEIVQEAVKRESKEETGLEVEPEDTSFFMYHYPNARIDIYAFRARYTSGHITLDEKHTEFKWVSQGDWKDFHYTPSVEATLKEFFK